MIRLLAGILAALVWAPAALAQETDFPLDDLPRKVEPDARVRCPKVDLVTYRGDVLRYHTPVRVYVGFRERLRRFEEVARDVAIEVYGRAPRRVRHLGTYNCRRIAAWPDYLSEHGLGNAVDVAGFDFAAVPRGQDLPARLPKALRRSFQVRLKPHWAATDAVGALHSRFLRTLATRLVERQDIFRVLLGPAYPGHADHFHFDCAPWRLVEIFVGPPQSGP